MILTAAPFMPEEVARLIERYEGGLLEPAQIHRLLSTLVATDRRAAVQEFRVVQKEAANCIGILGRHGFAEAGDKLGGALIGLARVLDLWPTP